LSNTTDVLKFVAEGRADFTFVESCLAEHFNKTSEIKLVATSKNPIRVYDNTFIFKHGEARLKRLLNKELELMKQSGEIKRLIENTPTSKIRSIAMGLVEIFGEVIPFNKEIIKSPFTNTNCVFYSYTIEEYRSSGKNRKWILIKKDTSNNKFYLKDETGQVLIDPNKAHIDLNKTYQTESEKDTSENIKQFLKEKNISLENFLGVNKRLKFTEYILKQKDKLYILGTAADNPLVEEESSVENSNDIMIQRGDFNSVYYISSKHETEVIKKYKREAIILLCIGIILTFISLFFFSR